MAERQEEMAGQCLPPRVMLVYWRLGSESKVSLRHRRQRLIDRPPRRIPRRPTPAPRYLNCSRRRPPVRQHERAPTTTSLVKRPFMGTSTRRANSTRGNRSRPSKVSSGIRRRPARPKAPDLHDIMAHLADAIAFVRVSQRSLSRLDVAYDEESFLRKGLAALDAVYTEIDFASIALFKKGRH